MRPVDTHLSRLYRGTFLFGLACGISIALSSLYLDERGYSKQDIGTLALFFASGLVLFALPAGSIIHRFSGKRALTVVMLGYSACVAGFPFMPTYATIAGIRFLDGMFSVGVWVASETILLSRADKEHKAHLTSLYAIWLSSGYVCGPLLAKGITHFLSVPSAFVIAGAFGLTSALYLYLRLPPDEPLASTHGEPTPSGETPSSEAPSAEVPAGERMSPLAILWRIKTSCFGAYSYGYFQASVVLFLPLFLIEAKNVAREDTIILPGLFCLGMLLFSNAAGRVADKVGHLRVVTILSFVGMLMVLGFVLLDSYWLMCVAVVGAGATFASMSPVALALTGVVTRPQDYSRANSIYNVFYAGGMLVGPPVTSVIFARFGGEAMLYHLAALWAAFVAFALVFMHDDPASRRVRTREHEPSVEPAPEG